MKNLILISLSLLFFSSCNNFLSQSKEAENMVQSLLDEDYDKAKEFLLPELLEKGLVESDTLSMQLVEVHKAIKDNLGEDVEISGSYYKKTWGIDNKVNEFALVELKGDGKILTSKVTFNPSTGNIFRYDLGSVMLIPSKLYLYILFIVAVLIVVFNIYAIIRVIRSQLKRKWLLIVGILLLNMPVFKYNWMFSSLNFNIISFQLLGAGFSLATYVQSTVSFALPLGAIIAFNKIKKNKKQQMLVEESNIIENESE